MPGCDCGLLMNFDGVSGCVYDETCLLRREGQECTGGPEESTCRAGLACCAYCVTGCQVCDPPCCPGQGYCMEDGCPPPPP